MRKNVILIVLATLLGSIGVTAQPRITTGQVNSIRNGMDITEAKKFFPIANRLMRQESLEMVAYQLGPAKFTSKKQDESEIQANYIFRNQSICDLYAVNNKKNGGAIDTLTLFIKPELTPEHLENELNDAHYIKKDESQQFHWWQSEDGTINLAIYYNYSNDYKTAMLFARIEKPAEETPVSEEPLSEVTVIDDNANDNANANGNDVLHFDNMIKPKTTQQNDWKMTTNIQFPLAVGGIADKLNHEALRSHLLANLVERQPRIKDDMSVDEILEEYSVSLHNKFWSEQVALVGEREFTSNFSISIMPDNQTREDVITYINKVETHAPGNMEDDYRIAANFSRETGELLTFDRVFKKSAKKVISSWLKDRYMENKMDIRETKELKDAFENALENFILGREGVTFIVVANDGQGLVENAYPFYYNDLKDYLR